MHYMEDLKDLLCAELKDYAEKGKRSGELSKADVEVIDTVLNSVKNIYKIDKYKEEMEGYSEDGNYIGEGRIYGTSYESGYSERGGSSYARGRGRNAKRDSMGRYSRAGGYSEEGYSEEGGSSYARGGQGGNRGGNRGGQGGMNRSSYRGGYSYDGAKDHMIDKLEEMLDMAETPQERKAIHRCIEQIEQA